MMDQKHKHYLTETDYDRLIQISQEGEGTVYSSTMYQRAFKSYSNQYNQLEYEGFVRLTHTNPRLMQPLYRLHDTMQQKVLGKQWWYEHQRVFRAVRRNMGMELG